LLSPERALSPKQNFLDWYLPNFRLRRLKTRCCLK
jgi:hypothetical protein